MLTQHRGGAFLFTSVDPATMPVPEALGPEQREVARTARDFAEREVRPRREALERHDWDTARQLLRRAGELGLLGVEAPEAYGGLGLDKQTAAVVARELAVGGASFAITFGVQSGIGMMPLVYFGTVDQKQRYLPGLASGERVAAYSLTEPGSGSDALGARTVARLSPDGRHYLLSGTKQWTTNAGFADLFVVYAKIDGEHFTSFLVERSFPGVSTGPEERKMGYTGSSTAQVILDEARVPVENLLHEPGKGHQVAFNTLNIGRFKLAPSCLGSSLNLLAIATRYAQERRQFGRPIASFRLIRRKLADMATRIYGLEAVTYRIAGLMDEATSQLDLAGDVHAAAAVALGEYAIECSVAKVLATEVLDFVVDEAVQIHGGNGYMREYEVENAYRDSRVNRIFEGTNEINRLLIPTQLFRRMRGGGFPPFATLGPNGESTLTAGGALDAEARLLGEARARFGQVAMLVLQGNLATLEEEQEVLAILGDLAIAIFTIESALARATRVVAEQGPERAAFQIDLARACAWEYYGWLVGRATEALTYLAPDDAGQASASGIVPLDRISLGRRIADRVLATGGVL